MSLAGGSLSAFLVIGVFVGDLDYVIGSAVWIIALFSWLFIFTDKGKKTESYSYDFDAPEYLIMPTKSHFQAERAGAEM
jgi:hypothetical protein